MARTRSLRTQWARHRVDHVTICGRSCANSGHYKPLCACVDGIFVNLKFVTRAARKNSGRAGSHFGTTDEAGVQSKFRYGEVSVIKGPGPPPGSVGFLIASRNIPVIGDAESIVAEMVYVSVPIEQR